jgi:hypothetical protein
MRKKSLSLEKEYRAWAGSRNRLLTLCSLMEDQFQEERITIQQEYDQRIQGLDQEEAGLSDADKASGSQPERLRDARRLAKERREKELDRLRARLAITDEENEETRDYASELVDEYDFRFASRISISCSSWDTARTCSVNISNSPYGNVRLTVSGDTPWVRATFGTLEKELRKGRPWWSLLRHDAVFFVVVVTVAASATLAITGIVSVTPLSSLFGDFAWVAIWALFGALMFATVPATNWLMTRLFPNFEVLDPDAVTGRKKFSRAMGLAVGGFVVLVTVLQGLAWILDRL